MLAAFCSEFGVSDAFLPILAQSLPTVFVAGLSTVILEGSSAIFVVGYFGYFFLCRDGVG